MKVAPLFLLALSLAAGAASAADNQPLFEDDFAVLDPAWGSASELQQVENKQMVLKPVKSSCFRALYQGDLFGDIDARVKVSLAAGPENESAGLIFWAADGENYYVAAATADGRFAVMRRVNGRWLYPVQFQAGESLKKGLNTVNELRLVTKGSSATLYLNGKEAVAFKGHPTTSENMIGLYGDSGTEICTWKYSDLQVVKPAP